MELDIVRPQRVHVKTIRVSVKVCDSGSYELLDAAGEKIGEIDQDYVPGFFPGQHCGDYLFFDIDIETGEITNWRRPQPSEVVEAFKLAPKPS